MRFRTMSEQSRNETAHEQEVPTRPLRSQPLLLVVEDDESTYELYSEVLADHGYPPLPEFEEPNTSPRSRPELAERFPLILTCAKPLWFCETQHRNMASMRRRLRDPEGLVLAAELLQRGQRPPQGAVRVAEDR